MNLYGTGTHRIVYHARGMTEGLLVTAYLWSPTLVRSDLQTFTELAGGIYYLDYAFAAAGCYPCQFFEDAAASHTGAVRVVTATQAVDLTVETEVAS